MGNAEQAHR